MACLLGACATDAYEKGEGEYSMMIAELADLTVDNNRKAVSATTDENERLLFDNPFTQSWFSTPDSVYRAIVYYNKLEGDRAEVISTSPVNVLRPHVIKDLKTDPVKFESAWLSTNRRYLNTSIYVMMGEAENEKLKQIIGMHADTLIAHADGRRTLNLIFYHDQGTMPEYYSQRAYLSIPLDSVDADTVSLSIHTYDDVVVRKFSLR